jgi:hypothetical protein
MTVVSETGEIQMINKFRLFLYVSVCYSVMCVVTTSVSGDVIRLVNGQSYECTFVSQTVQQKSGQQISIIQVRLSDGSKLEFNRSEIEYVQLSGGEVIVGTSEEMIGVDPLASRYLYAPSSFSLTKGKTYVSQKELFFTSAARGLTDNITILGGSILPALMAGEIFLISGAKISTRVGPNLRASAGFEVFSDLDINLGFVFGGGTLGGNNFNLSLIAGKPFAVGFGEKELGPFLTVVGLNKKLTRRLRFVSETWFIPDVVDGIDKGEQTYWLSGNVIRFLINNSFALDSGFIFFEGGGGESLPWLDFAYLF